MAIDDSFKKPGAIPFKWEIRPGVPKVQQMHQEKHQPPSCNHHRPFAQQNHQQSPKQQSGDHNHSFPSTPQKLSPPPIRYYFQPPPELRTRSFRSTPRTRSELQRFDRCILTRPEIVSPGCFPTPTLRAHKLKPNSKSKAEPDYPTDLETLSRWSVSSRKSLSPFRDSPLSSSFSSYRSSPRPVGDAEWAGFGLF